MRTVDAGLVEALELAVELDQIGFAIDRLAEHGAPLAEIADARRRHRRLCDDLLTRLRDRLCAEWVIERIH